MCPFEFVKNNFGAQFFLVELPEENTSLVAHKSQCGIRDGYIHYVGEGLQQVELGTTQDVHFLAFCQHRHEIVAQAALHGGLRRAQALGHRVRSFLALPEQFIGVF